MGDKKGKTEVVGGGLNKVGQSLRVLGDLRRREKESQKEEEEMQGFQV